MLPTLTVIGKIRVLGLNFGTCRFIYMFSDLQINGQQSNVVNQTCNEYGIKVLEFSSQVGQLYHFKKPLSKEFGDQPLIEEILDAKYTFVKKSEMFPLAGTY